MSDTPAAGHNLPPSPTFEEMLEPAAVRALIDAELDREPISADGVAVPSIRTRDPALMDMCKRFLAAYPTIETDDAETKATDVLSVCQKFPRRVETVRKELKQPVWDAGVAIDKSFASYGGQMEVRPLTGPVAGRRKPPYTLAEQITIRLAAYKDARDAKIRAEALAQADAADAEARRLEEAAKAGTVPVEEAIAAYQTAEKHQETAAAPMNVLTRSRGDNIGSSSGKRVRTFEITAPHLVPRQYCVPSEALIRAAIGQADATMPIIPGVTIVDQTDVNRR